MILDTPISPSTVVGGAINRINKKNEHAGIAWRIKGSGLGRAGKVVWIAR